MTNLMALMKGLSACIFGQGKTPEFRFADPLSHQAALRARHLYGEALSAKRSADTYELNLRNPPFIDHLGRALRYESKLSFRTVRDLLENPVYSALTPDGERVPLRDVVEAEWIPLREIHTQSAALYTLLDGEPSDADGEAAFARVANALVFGGSVRMPLYDLRQLRMDVEKQFSRAIR